MREQRRKRLRQLLKFLCKQEQTGELPFDQVANLVALKWGLTQHKVWEYLNFFHSLGAIDIKKTAKGRLIKITDFGKELSAKAEEEEEEKVAEPLSMPSFES